MLICVNRRDYSLSELGCAMLVWLALFIVGSDCLSRIICVLSCEGFEPQTPHTRYPLHLSFTALHIVLLLD